MAEANTETEVKDIETKTDSEKLYPKTELDKIISERDKAKQTSRELQSEIETIKAKLKADEDSKLKADGKLQELLNAKESELSELKSKTDGLDKLKSDNEALENELRMILTEGLSKESKEFCKSMTIEQVKAFVQLLKKENKIPVDSSPGGKPGSPEKKTIEEKLKGIYKT